MNSILNEYGVLGSLLIDPSLFPEAAELPDDMFSSVPLQEIFRAMRHQYEESGSFDALTVRVEAGRQLHRRDGQADCWIDGHNANHGEPRCLLSSGQGSCACSGSLRKIAKN